uniref:Spermatosis associated 46 n=1 Tax=Crocodylus porosus TaxID=8502 RepID=A0A7M4FQZ0_CROPO
MENFSLLTISGPCLPSCCTMKSTPDLPSLKGTSNLLAVAKVTGPEDSFQPLLFLVACVLTKVHSNESPGRNCIIYRPWFSPYSYLVDMDKTDQLGACSFPDALADSDWDTDQSEDLLESISSSSCSLEKAYLHESSRKTSSGREARNSITSRDILTASKWQPLPHNGYKCVACCRVFPTLHALKTHIKCSFKEGFSCKVYYHKLKALWEKERKARPDDGLPFNATKMTK